MNPKITPIPPIRVFQDPSEQRRFELSAPWVEEKAALGWTQDVQQSALKVWCPEREDYRYPSWQFKAEGQLQEGWEEVLSCVERIVGLKDGQWRTFEPRIEVEMREWLIVEWFEQVSTGSQGKPHGQWFQEDPQAVLAWAKMKANEDPDAGW